MDIDDSAARPAPLWLALVLVAAACSPAQEARMIEDVGECEAGVADISAIPTVTQPNC